MTVPEYWKKCILGYLCEDELHLTLRAHVPRGQRREARGLLVVAFFKWMLLGPEVETAYAQKIKKADCNQSLSFLGVDWVRDWRKKYHIME